MSWNSIWFLKKIDTSCGRNYLGKGGLEAHFGGSHGFQGVSELQLNSDLICIWCIYIFICRYEDPSMCWKASYPFKLCGLVRIHVNHGVYWRVLFSFFEADAIMELFSMVGLSAQNSKAGMRAQGWIFGIFFVLLAWRFNSEWPVVRENHVETWKLEDEMT